MIMIRKESIAKNQKQWQNFLEQAELVDLLKFWLLVDRHIKTLEDKKEDMLKDGIREIDIEEEKAIMKQAKEMIEKAQFCRFGEIEKDIFEIISNFRVPMIYNISQDWVKNYEN